MRSHQADAIAVTGDWNETEDPGEKTNWSNHAIGDVLPVPNEPYHPITTMRSAGLFDPWPASIAGRHATISSTSPTARFDYTLYTNSASRHGEVFDTKQFTSTQLATLNAVNHTSFTATDSASASDHLPVLSVLRVGYAPVIVNVAREGAVFSITYEKILAPGVSYNVEQSTDLMTWTPAQASDQTVAVNANLETTKSSVAAGNTSQLFLRVRATIN